MNAALALSAAQILAIPLSSPEMLFSEPTSVKDEHRQLAKRWHPDMNADAAAPAVIAHINVLAEAADEKVKIGQWERPFELELTRKRDKARIKVRYKRKIPFELGQSYYNATKLVYVLDKQFNDLFDAGNQAIANFSFPSDRIKKEMDKYLPSRRDRFETSAGECVLVVDKTDDAFLLRDVQAALGGKIDPKHVAWIMSASLNIACYLEVTGITHNGISADSLFVSPKFHSIMIYGGWWYSAPVGSKLAAVPTFSHRIAPPDILRAKKADPRIDLACIRAMGRELLGDITGMTLLGKGVPKPMVDFLRQPSSSSARKDYAAWSQVLEASFGPRRFTELDIKESDIFK